MWIRGGESSSSPARPGKSLRITSRRSGGGITRLGSLTVQAARSNEAARKGRTMRRYLCNVVAACLLLNIIAVGTVVADDAVKNFNIPEEDLGSALRDFGRQSNQEVLFSTDIVRDIKTPGLKGSYTVEAAIATLLAGTDLTVRR